MLPLIRSFSHIYRYPDKKIHFFEQPSINLETRRKEKSHSEVKIFSVNQINLANNLKSNEDTAFQSTATVVKPKAAIFAIDPVVKIKNISGIDHRLCLDRQAP